jgi:hypothetical protein
MWPSWKMVPALSKVIVGRMWTFYNGPMLDQLGMADSAMAYNLERRNKAR